MRVRESKRARVTCAKVCVEEEKPQKFSQYLLNTRQENLCVSHAHTDLSDNCISISTLYTYTYIHIYSLVLSLSLSLYSAALYNVNNLL